MNTHMAGRALDSDRLGRVLVVDDDAAMRRIVARLAERAGCEATMAEDGFKALELWADEAFDIVLIDYNMPGLTGAEVVRRIRATATGKDVSILMITGLVTSDNHIEALAAGVDDFVAKPIDSALLVARVRHHVQRCRLLRQRERLMTELRRYVSRDAVDAIVEGRGVERIESTIFFSDLRGFTATCEVNEAPVLFATLNVVISAQVEIIERSGGYVDKFSGDGLFAVFEGKDGPSNAVRAALETMEALRHVDGLAIWQEPPVGIGIAHGAVIRGPLGSDCRCERTVIGPAVNLAARLCGAAGALEIMMEDRIAKGIGLESGELRLLSIRGIHSAVAVRVVSRRLALAMNPEQTRAP